MSILIKMMVNLHILQAEAMSEAGRARVAANAPVGERR